MATRQPISIDSSAVEGTISGWILSKIETLDEQYGAAEWDSYHIAIGTAIALLLIKFTTRDAGNVTWWGVCNAVVTGFLSAACIWLNVNAAETLTGTSEPLRSILCQGPLTSLHRIIPAIAMGYGFVDIIEGLSHGLDFLLHGIATFTIMGYFVYYQNEAIVMPFLLMELSTIFLNLAKASFYSELGIWANTVMFVLTFFVVRIFISPYLWYEIMTTVIQNLDNPTSQACLPWHSVYVIFVFGMFFHLLNGFWAYKIIRKIQRISSGRDNMDQRKDDVPTQNGNEKKAK